MENKQTPVEYLLKELWDNIISDEYLQNLSFEKTQLAKEIARFAKHCEKQLIINAFDEGTENNNFWSKKYKNGEDFYNKFIKTYERESKESH